MTTTMGVCAGGPKDPKDREVGSELERDRKADKKIHKLLLLGAGGSGKSTFFKQLKSIHGEGHSKREREGFKRQIYGQMIEAMQTMIKQCHQRIDDAEEMGGEDEKEDSQKYAIPEKYDTQCRFILEKPAGCAEMDEEIGQILEILWTECEPIKLMFENRHKICVPDSTAFFLDNIESIAAKDYIPTDEHLLLVRYRTTGMTEKKFVIQESHFKICDVGGQRNERKKWIHFFDGLCLRFIPPSMYVAEKKRTAPRHRRMPLSSFCVSVSVCHRTRAMYAPQHLLPSLQLPLAHQRARGRYTKQSPTQPRTQQKTGVTAVLFVISLTCYDEVPFEDVTDLDADLEEKNNMLESISVFSETVNSETFKNTGFILFLNKKDLMKEKIMKVPITPAFPDYSGAQEYKPSVEYIRDQFIAINLNTDREIFVLFFSFSFSFSSFESI